VNDLQLQRFIQDCRRMREAIKTSEEFREFDYRILKSNLALLLMDLEERKAKRRSSLTEC
jgi:hypothetical protein